jgi:hypothetical protein
MQDKNRSEKLYNKSLLKRLSLLPEFCQPTFRNLTHSIEISGDGFSIGRKTDDIESRLNAAIDAFKVCCNYAPPYLSNSYLQVRTQLNTNRVQSEMQGDMRYNFAKQHDDMVDIRNLLIQVIEELGIARQIGVDKSLQSPKGQDLIVGMAAGPLSGTSQKASPIVVFI